MPQFVKVWHPIDKKKQLPFLKFGDLETHTGSDKLNALHQKLQKETDQIVVRDLLSEELFTWEPLSFGTYTSESVLDSLKQIQTHCMRAPLVSKQKFPVIVYHHGTMGSATENHLMAEYFASHGYIFISCNFHLPYSKRTFGMMECTSCDDGEINNITAFAKTLSRSSEIYFIGHSWGAQAGWYSLAKNKVVTGFVSMETTIEYKTDTLEIKDKWPCVYSSLKESDQQLTMPVLLMANTMDSLPFRFFQEESSQKMYYASSKGEFIHESFTSLYLLRYFLHPTIHQPDLSSLESQLALYTRHIQMMDDFFHSICTRKKNNFSLNYPEFYISHTD